MRILITGGAGFIGSHTADALLARGHEVRVLDSLEEPVHPGRRVPDYLDRRVEFMRGDVRDEATLLRALQDQDAVYHLAAFQDYLPQFSRFVDVNVASTARIYELALREKLPLRRVIVASSRRPSARGSTSTRTVAAAFPTCGPTRSSAAASSSARRRRASADRSAGSRPTRASRTRRIPTA